VADITRLRQYAGGAIRGIDLTQNSLVTNTLKLTTDGGSTSTELTKAILDKLLLVQSAAAVDGTFDNRYYTETELGSAAGTSGAELIGVKATAANHSPAAANVEAWLTSIDTALATAGSPDFDDSTFRISDDGDDTKKIAFQAAGITTGTVRTITMPDTDVDLGDIATNSTDIGNLQSALGSSGADMGSYTGNVLSASGSAKANLQELADYAENTRSIINNFEWYGQSAIDYITDNTLAPPTEVSGDVYVLAHDGGAPNANWDGASAGDIVEFDGSSWIATTPTTGMFISVDDESSSLRQWGGSSWDQKYFESTTASTGLTKVGFDIRLADATAANGIAISSGAVSISLASDPGLEFSGGSLRVLVDPSGALERVTAGLDVKDLGIDNARLAAGAVDNAKVAAGAAIETSKLADAAELAEAVTFFASTDISASEAETLTDASNADSLHKHAVIKRSFDAGEAMAADKLHLVRLAKSGETAGRIFKAEIDASSSDDFYVIGIAKVGGSALTAGDPVDVTMLGEVELGSADTPFGAGDIGLPVFLTADGTFSVTAPSNNDEAVVRVGMVLETNKILVQAVQVVSII